jgi:hypothetical protein
LFGCYEDKVRREKRYKIFVVLSGIREMWESIEEKKSKKRVKRKKMFSLDKNTHVSFQLNIISKRKWGEILDKKLENF